MGAYTRVVLQLALVFIAIPFSYFVVNFTFPPVTLIRLTILQALLSIVGIILLDVRTKFIRHYFRTTQKGVQSHV